MQSRRARQKQTKLAPSPLPQYFWAGAVERAGAGPAGVPEEELTAEALAGALCALGRPEVKAAAEAIAASMAQVGGRAGRFEMEAGGRLAGSALARTFFGQAMAFLA